MKQISPSLIILAGLLLAQTSFAQTNTATTSPFSRKLLTSEEIGAMGAPVPPSPSAAGNGNNPSLASAEKTKEELLQKYSSGKAPTNPTAVNPATPRPPAGPSTSPTMAPMQAQTPTMPTKPRFVEAPLANEESLSFFTSKGQAKDAFYIGKYSAPAYVQPVASLRAPQSAALEAVVNQLRSQGVEESKIGVELNRLTPAEFAHWAQMVR
jgi:hypothetical protein